MAAKHYYSDDLVSAILVRVPGKSLLRFKSVCKQWSLLISDSIFVKSHLKSTNSLKRKRTDLFVYHCNGYGLLLSKLGIENDLELEDLGYVLTAKKVKSPLDAGSTLRGVTHCDGMLSIYTWKNWKDKNNNNNMYVWNPLTKEHKKFPMRKFPEDFIWEGFGFGYDSSIDDYIAVHVMCYGLRHNYRQWKIQSLRLKKGSWDDAQIDRINSFREFVFKEHQIGNFFNGCLYWIAEKWNVHENIKDRTIAYFDLEKNVMRIETSPPPPDMLTGVYHVLGILDASLCLGKTTTMDKTCFDIWIMKEDGVTGTKSWSKVITVGINPIIASFKRIFVAFTGSGTFVAMAGHLLQLHNLKDKSDKVICVNESYGNRPFWDVLISYEESLVSPNSKSFF